MDNSSKHSLASVEKCDAVIVGAGAAGMVYAARLAEQGKDVLVLETGPARKAEDLYSSQIWARRLKWSTPHVNEFGGKSRMHVNMNAGRGFGGAAIHHYGVWPRMHDDDFRMHSIHGRGLDWGMGYDDIRPYYDRVQQFVGVAGDASLEPWRPEGDPYPLPPVPKFRHGELLENGFKALDIPTSPIPMAVLTKSHNGRPPCIWDGWCDAGCPTGAIANPLMTYMPRALKHGARFQADSHVTRVLTNRKGDRATGVEYVDSSGQKHVQHADLVILAAFTLETTKILLNSADGGLANSSGMLGKYMMVHPSVMLFGMFDEETHPYMGPTGGHIFSQAGFPKTKHADGVFGSRQWEIGLVLKPNDLLGVAMTRPDIHGKDLHRFIKQGSKHMAAMGAVCEDQPLVENQLILDSTRDEFGMPRAKLVYTVSRDGLGLAMQARDEGIKVIKAAGAKEVWSGPIAAQHICGGTIMGKDPKTSVCNTYLQAHDISNLVVGSQSTFAGSSSCNSTFTVHALAERSSDYLLANWSGLTT